MHTARGVAYLHAFTPRIVHRDLKCQVRTGGRETGLVAVGATIPNSRSRVFLLLITSAQNLLVDQAWNVKCGDFGLSREVFDSAHTRIGSVQW